MVRWIWLLLGQKLGETFSSGKIIPINLNAFDAVCVCARWLFCFVGSVSRYFDLCLATQKKNKSAFTCTLYSYIVNDIKGWCSAHTEMKVKYYSFLLITWNIGWKLTKWNTDRNFSLMNIWSQILLFATELKSNWLDLVDWIRDEKLLWWK